MPSSAGHIGTQVQSHRQACVQFGAGQVNSYPGMGGGPPRRPTQIPTDFHPNARYPQAVNHAPACPLRNGELHVVLPSHIVR